MIGNISSEVDKNTAINETLGNEFIDKILVKLRLKKV